MLHLVDPNYRLCSTRNVPPQRHDWWADAVCAELEAVGLPPEIARMILDRTGEWPIGLEEAEEMKQQIEKEHQWATVAMAERTDYSWGVVSTT